MLNLDELLPDVFALDCDFPGINIDPVSMDASLADLQLDLKEDIYELQFHNTRHINFIEKDEKQRLAFLSVSYQLLKFNTFSALRTTETGYSHFSLTINPTGQFEDDVEKALKEEFPLSEIYLVTDPGLPDDLLTVEKKHAQKRKNMKIGVVYCKTGQISNNDMFANTPEDCGPGFWKFIDHFGRPIDLEGWTKYRGDMRPPGKCWYDEWNNIEICYHVCPTLNTEEKRRLIGNDITMVYYFDSGDTDPLPTFNLAGIDSFGEVPQVFVVVQPSHDYTKYRIGFFSKKNITRHAPYVPFEKTFFSLEETKTLVLTKLLNGLVVTAQCPPMNRLFQVPRRATIKDIVDKYPKPVDTATLKAPPSSSKDKGNKGKGKGSEKVKDPLQSTDMRSNRMKQSDSSKELFDISLHADVYMKKLKSLLDAVPPKCALESSGFNVDSALFFLKASLLSLFSSLEEVKKYGPSLLDIPVKSFYHFKEKSGEAAGVVLFDNDKLVIAFNPLQKVPEKLQQQLVKPEKKAVSISNQKKNVKIAGQVLTLVSKKFTAVMPSLFELLKLVNFGQTKIFLCGLGSGGALAVFAAQVLLNEQILDDGQEITAIYTFGSFKVGDDTWAKEYPPALKKKVVRVIEKSDIVSNYPEGLGYGHVGEEKIFGSFQEVSPTHFMPLDERVELYLTTLNANHHSAKNEGGGVAKKPFLIKPNATVETDEVSSSFDDYQRPIIERRPAMVTLADPDLLKEFLGEALSPRRMNYSQDVADGVTSPRGNEAQPQTLAFKTNPNASPFRASQPRQNAQVSRRQSEPRQDHVLSSNRERANNSNSGRQGLTNSSQNGNSTNTNAAPSSLTASGSTSTPSGQGSPSHNSGRPLPDLSHVTGPSPTALLTGSASRPDSGRTGSPNSLAPTPNTLRPDSGRVNINLNIGSKEIFASQVPPLQSSLLQSSSGSQSSLASPTSSGRPLPQPSAVINPVVLQQIKNNLFVMMDAMKQMNNAEVKSNPALNGLLENFKKPFGNLQLLQGLISKSPDTTVNHLHSLLTTMFDVASSFLIMMADATSPPDLTFIGRFAKVTKEIIACCTSLS